MKPESVTTPGNELADTVRWVLGDAAYKAPEQITAEFIHDRYLTKLAQALAEYEKKTLGVTLT